MDWTGELTSYEITDPVYEGFGTFTGESGQAQGVVTGPKPFHLNSFEPVYLVENGETGNGIELEAL
jgi:hypothetical protein